MKNDDTRVQFTKKVLKDALLRILKDKPIGKVTIKELCEEAGLNRGTFYLHYNEPNDVLKEIESDFVREQLAFFDPYLKNDNPDQLAKLFRAVMQLILNWLSGNTMLSAKEFAHRLDLLGHYCHLAIEEFCQD